MIDSTTLAKLSQGAMIAIEACYQAKCLSSYHNKTRAKARETGHTPNSVLYGVGLAEIVAFLQEQGLESHCNVVAFITRQRVWGWRRTSCDSVRVRNVDYGCHYCCTGTWMCRSIIIV